MPFLIALVTLFALAVSDTGEPVRSIDAPRYLLLAVLCVLAAPVYTAIVVAATLRGLRKHPERQQEILARLAKLRRGETVLWIASSLAISYALCWGGVVQHYTGLENTWLVDELAILAPVLLPVFLCWATLSRVQRELRQHEETPPPPWGVCAYVWQQARQQMGIVLVPLIVMLALFDTLRWLDPDWAEQRSGWLLIPLAVVAVLVLLPALLRRLWVTEPLPHGPLRTRLEAAGHLWGFYPSEILVWRTGGGVVNAAVAGVVPRLRYVFLSDGLLAHFSEDEIEAVFGHEVGHVRHHHLWLRAMVLFAPISAWLACGDRLGAPLLAWAETLAAATGLNVQAIEAVAVLGGLSLYGLLVFGGISRRLERQADLIACLTAGQSDCRGTPGIDLAQGVDTFVRALEKLTMLNGTGRKAFSWQHPSAERRVEFLQDVMREPQRGLAFERRMRLVGSLVSAVTLGSLASWTWHLAVTDRLF